jgi:hypothetical protein
MIPQIWRGLAPRAICPNRIELTFLDPESGELAPVFNPRTDRWEEHFI